MTSTEATIMLRVGVKSVELIFLCVMACPRNRGRMAGSRPLDLGPIASRCSLGVLGVGDEVYNLYGGSHHAASRRRIGGADFLCIMACRRNRGRMAGSRPLDLGPIASRCSLGVYGSGVRSMISTEAAIMLRVGVESVELIFVHYGM